jgi:hypothetical protein
MATPNLSSLALAQFLGRTFRTMGERAAFGSHNRTARWFYACAAFWDPPPPPQTTDDGDI